MALIKRAKPADAIEEEEAEQLEELAEDEIPMAVPLGEPPADSEIDDDEQPGDAEKMAALAEASEAAEAPAEGSSDGLLDMFSTVGVHVEDKTMLVGLAGEVDIADLVSELGVVAAALGIVKGQHATEVEAAADEALAA